MATLIKAIRNRSAKIHINADKRLNRAVTRDEIQQLFREELDVRTV
ncbi:hypothetical protein [Sulfitobacter sp. EhC04]|nr:hypothetical protein [Sulfitobacter sp. EhC04]